MNDTIQRLYEQTTQWLLEPDLEQPGVRYFTLRDLLDFSEDESELQNAQAAIMASGPVSSILAAQEPEGYWVRSGAGYTPKYTGTVWQMIFLSQFGADGADQRVQAACEYLLSHTMASNSVFSHNGAPSGFYHCLSGNLIAALIDLGKINDDRVRAAIEREAQFITGEGIADSADSKATPRYYRSGTSGPTYACAHNLHLPCAWGAVKALLALGRVPITMRSEKVKRAIDQSVTFLLGHDPALADYPSVYGNTPSADWFKLGYPLGYRSDVLQNIEALAAVGYIHDPRLSGALAMIESKQNDQRRWNQECRYRNMWAQVEPVAQPSKWVTLRVLRILKAAYTEM
jgi:hypothetical protein